MANRILTAEGWEGRVRDKVGVHVADLPDTVLQGPDVITVAEAKVIKAVPEYESLVDDDRVFLEAATVCACAIQVIDTLAARLPTRTKGPGMDIEITVDWVKRKAELVAERDEYLGNLQGDATGIGGFWLAGPSR